MFLVSVHVVVALNSQSQPNIDRTFHDRCVLTCGTVYGIEDPENEGRILQQKSVDWSDIIVVKGKSTQHTRIPSQTTTMPRC